MNETSKTVAFIVSAGILATAAGATHFMTQPRNVTGFEKVGKEFFPDFQDALVATSLEVTVFDADMEDERQFAVALSDGRWRIPSHHNYPAEAAERLARTATSVMGLKREACVARRVAEHEKYGVVDPADASAEVESAGQRITLHDGQGEILADYIIGKPAGTVADDENEWGRIIDREADYYFVRRPDEKETFVASVQIDLSARFADWIEPDLLKIEQDELVRLEIDNYELVTNQRYVSKNVLDRLTLTRPEYGSWEMEDLRPEMEELDPAKVSEIVNLLDSMTISGVRPKLKLNGELLVQSDLTINESLENANPEIFGMMARRLSDELEFRGFTIGATAENPNQRFLLASKGELRAATNTGIRYTLYFGRTVTGDEKEIEIGASVTPEQDETGSENTQSPDDPENVSADGAALSEDELTLDDPQSSSKSRFVAVRVDYDPQALGEPPVEPQEPGPAPKKPEGYDEWKLTQAAVEAGEDAPADDGDAEQEPRETESQDAAVDDPSSDDAPLPPADIAASQDEKFRQYEEDLATRESAAIQYTTDVELYEIQLASYEKRQQRGRELFEELNERFAEWYYVVPAESLSTLKMTREDLVNIMATPPPSFEPPISPGESRLDPAPNIEFPDSPDEDPATDGAAENSDDGNDDVPRNE